jgi:Cu/Ag efflux protein CusF
MKQWLWQHKPKSTLDGLKVVDKIDFVAMQEHDALFVTLVLKTSPYST